MTRFSSPVRRANVRRPSGTWMTPIVTTTWAFGYFSMDERAEFVDQLRAQSTQRRIAWVSAVSVLFGISVGIEAALTAVARNRADRRLIGEAELAPGAGGRGRFGHSLQVLPVRAGGEQGVAARGAGGLLEAVVAAQPGLVVRAEVVALQPRGVAHRPGVHGQVQAALAAVR